MLQHEVAETIVAAPGRISLLALSVQLYAEPRLLFTVPPSAFRPPPKVESAVLRLDVRELPAVAVDDVDSFFRFLRAGFSAPASSYATPSATPSALMPRRSRKRCVVRGLIRRLRAQALTWSSGPRSIVRLEPKRETRHEAATHRSCEDQLDAGSRSAAATMAITISAACSRRLLCTTPSSFSTGRPSRGTA